MPWGHIDYESLRLPLGHFLKGIRHQLVMLALDEGWPHFLDEMKEALLGPLPVLQFAQMSGEELNPLAGVLV